MKSLVIAAACCAVSLLLGCSLRLPKTSATSSVSGEFADAFSHGRFDQAAALFHYPPYEQGVALAEDMREVAVSLNVIQSHFGEIAELNVARSASQAIEVGIAGGSVDDWMQSMNVESMSFEVTFSKWGHGRLTFEFIRVAGVLRLRSVKFGLTPSLANAERINQVGQALTPLH